MKIFATIISSFYMGLLLGIAFCIYYQREMPELGQSWEWIGEKSRLLLTNIE